MEGLHRRPWPLQKQPFTRSLEAPRHSERLFSFIRVRWGAPGEGTIYKCVQVQHSFYPQIRGSSHTFLCESLHIAKGVVWVNIFIQVENWNAEKDRPCSWSHSTKGEAGETLRPPDYWLWKVGRMREEEEDADRGARTHAHPSSHPAPTPFLSFLCTVWA